MGGCLCPKRAIQNRQRAANEQHSYDKRGLGLTCPHRGYGALLADDVLLQPLLQREPAALLDLPATLLLLELQGGGSVGSRNGMSREGNALRGSKGGCKGERDRGERLKRV